MFRLAALFVSILSTSLWAAVIVDQGKPQTVIIISQNAPDTVKYAADELQSYIKQVSGVSLAITHEKSEKLFNIFVGENEFTKKLGLSTADLKSDGFKITTGSNWLAIFGRDYAGPVIFGLRNPWRYMDTYNDKLKLGAFGECGTLYGVYRFLEDICGIRWYMPGELGTVVPKNKTISFSKISLVVSPDYEYRYAWICHFPEAKDDARWFRRVGFGAPYPAQIIDSFSFFTHKYKDKYPECFALIEGQRDFTNLSCVQQDGNLCLSNPKVAELWVKDICEYFEQNPAQRIFPLSPNDGMVKICECKECQKQLSLELGSTGKYSNYVWAFVNKVAAEVAKKYPDKFVGCIAYDTYCYPPSNIDKLHSNVAVMICKSRSGYMVPDNKKKMWETIRGWQSKTKNIYFWEYYLYSWAPWRGCPIVYPHIISEDLKALKGVGKGEFIEGESNFTADWYRIETPAMSHINFYVTAKLLWNADLNVDDLMNEYYTKFYGPADEPMKAFWTYAEEIWMTRGKLNGPINIYPKNELDKLTTLLESAKSKVSGDSVYRKRIDLIEAEFNVAKRKLSNVRVVNKPVLKFTPMTEKITIDGLLNEPAWKKVEPIAFVDKEGEATKYKTWMLATCDNEAMYFAFINYDPEMKKLVANATQRDQNHSPGIWDDDNIELFIMPDPKNTKADYHWIINAKGVMWDAKIVDDPLKPDLSWNSDTQAKTSLEENRWVLEVRIPFKDLGIEPASGKSFIANFYRDRYCKEPGIYSGWSPTLTHQHANPDRFGLIMFP
jgi:hypothetical protein